MIFDIFVEELIKACDAIRKRQEEKVLQWRSHKLQNFVIGEESRLLEGYELSPHWIKQKDKK